MDFHKWVDATAHRDAPILKLQANEKELSQNQIDVRAGELESEMCILKSQKD